MKFQKGFTPWNKGLKGIHLSPKSEFKEGNHYSIKTEFKEGQESWNKGKDFLKDESHPQWKGDSVGYNAFHSWINRKLGSFKKCSNCYTTVAKKYEWANISGEYKRDLDDWIRLCTKCHHQVDDIANKGWKTKKEAICAVY